MKKNIYARIATAVVGGLAVLCVTGVKAQGTGYTLQDLGPIGGHAINDAGQITGGVKVAGVVKAFRITPRDTNADGIPDTWQSDTDGDGQNDLLQVIGPPAGFASIAGNAINASGQMAATTTGPQVAAFIDAAGAPETVSKTHSWARGINDLGALTGVTWPQKGGVYASIWKKTATRRGSAWSVTNLGWPAGFSNSIGWSINNDGIVAGRAFDSAQTSIVPAIWLPAARYGLPQGWTVLPGLGGPGGDAWVINNKAQVAGASRRHAALWLLEPAFELPADAHSLHPAASAFTDSVAYGINDANDGVLQVVGYMHDNVAVQVGYVWDSVSKQAVDLNTITTNLPGGWRITEAKAVNDAGHILAVMSRVGESGTERACILIPAQ